MTFERVPEPRYDYLLGLMDDTGVLEHSRYGVPRRSHGYTTDDAARALIVFTRAPDDVASPVVPVLLSFLLDAIGSDGLVRNRLQYDRRWRDAPHTGDHHGRTIWALGVVASSELRQEWREPAWAALHDVRPPEGGHLRPYALAALGAAAVWEESPGDAAASTIFDRAIDRLTVSSGSWHEPRLSYGNGRLPHALLRMGQVLDRSDLVELGLDRLTWLVEVETSGDHYSFTPVGGWSPGEPRPGFDQQPLEAAAIAGAASTAWELTRSPRWEQALDRAVRWLLGDNDIGVPLLDPQTGACRDGLTAVGVNENRGAESTIAALSALQDWHRVSRLAQRGVRTGD